mgnify:CR=1 FL=1
MSHYTETCHRSLLRSSCITNSCFAHPVWQDVDFYVSCDKFMDSYNSPSWQVSAVLILCHKLLPCSACVTNRCFLCPVWQIDVLFVPCDSIVCVWLWGVVGQSWATRCYVCTSDDPTCFDPYSVTSLHEQDCSATGFINDGSCSKNKTHGKIIGIAYSACKFAYNDWLGPEIWYTVSSSCCSSIVIRMNFGSKRGQLLIMNRGQLVANIMSF